ncbi:hypothetical protein GCM10010885_01340 [Alicyclobacillus cellulosilyticus]|uniref:Uncharacterized protein n=1 Tax=Alicyclobacillus cellulosilyticus TaxID=1003997 RepID=A0A917K0Z3_9BACL|nr:hypothetical protein [Alicyclobacillus cellulosilyticus]GGI95465.1 hypothetical protein GCM10010885_01340 [Alicyclobacillus cellulosilyticus]
MPHYGLILEQSRKARAARHVYEYLRQQANGVFEPAVMWQNIAAWDGVRVPQREKYRVLNIRLHEEHLSPYFKTDMNLFHMLMLDESADVMVYRADKGWLFVFEGIPASPKPFGQSGYDTR